MDYRYERNEIGLYDESGRRLARVEFPEIGEQTVEVTHTIVDPSLQGQGIAGKLMEALVSSLRQSERKAELSCSYAVKWFAAHPEVSDVLKGENSDVT